MGENETNSHSDEFPKLDLSRFIQLENYEKEKKMLLKTIDTLHEEKMVFANLYEEEIKGKAVLNEITEKFSVLDAYIDIKSKHDQCLKDFEDIKAELLSIQMKHRECDSLIVLNKELQEQVGKLKEDYDLLNENYAQLNLTSKERMDSFDRNVQENSAALEAEFQVKEQNYLLMIENLKVSHSKKVQTMRTQHEKTCNDLKDALLTIGQLHSRIHEQRDPDCHQTLLECTIKEMGNRIAELEEELANAKGKVIKLEDDNQQLVSQAKEIEVINPATKENDDNEENRNNVVENFHDKTLDVSMIFSPRKDVNSSLSRRTSRKKLYKRSKSSTKGVTSKSSTVVLNDTHESTDLHKKSPKKKRKLNSDREIDDLILSVLTQE